MYLYSSALVLPAPEIDLTSTLAELGDLSSCNSRTLSIYLRRTSATSAIGFAGRNLDGAQTRCHNVAINRRKEKSGMRLPLKESSFSDDGICAPRFLTLICILLDGLECFHYN